MNKYVILIVIVIVLFNIIFFVNKLTKDKVKKHFVRFNSANIEGELQNIRIANKGVRIKLKENKIEYVFYPNTNDLNENKKFDHTAERGDIVMKSAYSDTLKLIRKDKVLLYTFQKFNL